VVDPLWTSISFSLQCGHHQPVPTKSNTIRPFVGSIKLATTSKPPIALHRAITSPFKNVQVQNDGVVGFAQPPQHGPQA